jgi:hypothetical protein
MLAMVAGRGLASRGEGCDLGVTSIPVDASLRLLSPPLKGGPVGGSEAVRGGSVPAATTKYSQLAQTATGLFSSRSLHQVSYSLMLSAVISTVAAVVFTYVAVRLSKRLSLSSRMAAWAFVVWWIGVAGFLFLWNGLAVYLVVAPLDAFHALVVLRYLSYLLLCGACAALMAHLCYLFTGNRTWLVAWSVYYAGVFLGLVYLIATSDPVGVDVRRWRVGLEYVAPLGRAYQLLLMLLILPTTVGALAYFTLRFKTDDRYMRLRITLVSWSIAVWGLSSLLARIAEHDWWQVLTRSGIGLIAAGLILFAYEAPESVRRRLDGGLGQHPPGTKQTVVNRQKDERRRQRNEALLHRMNDLV